jgi:DNA-binding Lrp family transcriptional regulator
VISLQATMVLEQIALTERHGAARGLSKKLGIGRDKTQRLIKELRDNGLVSTHTFKTGPNAFGKTLKLTEAGYHVLTVRTSTLLNGINHNLSLDIDYIGNYKRILGASAEGEDGRVEEEWSLGSYEQDPDELAELRRKSAQEKRDVKRDIRSNRYAKKEAERKNRISADWSASDTAFEFGKRVSSMWHVEEWSGTKKDFIHAINTARISYETNGAHEEQMMDRFFGTLAQQKHITSPHIIWKLFIKEYPVLALTAKITTTSEESIRRQQELADLDWKKRFNV